MADWLTYNLGRNLNDVSRAVYSGFEVELAEFSLSFLDFIILVNCHEGPENTASGIARLTDFDQGRISRAVNQLVNRGLIQRRRLRSDRRVIQLALTEEGKTVAPTVLNRVLECNAALLQDVTAEERAAFVTVSRKIIANYEAMQSA